MSDASENTPKRTKKLWKPGQSGNPSGRPRGSLNKTTIAVQELLQGDAEKLTRKAIELALSGDTTALRLCLERLSPPARDTPIKLELPEINRIQDLPQATSAILAAVSCGELMTTQAERLSKIIESHINALELSELEARIRELEKKQEKK